VPQADIAPVSQLKNKEAAGCDGGLNGGRAVLPSAEPSSQDETRIGPELDHLPLTYLLRMLIKPALVSVIGSLAAEPAAVLARQFMTRNDPLSGVGDGAAALEEAQLLMYPSGGSQERIERGSQSPRATSKPAADGLPMPCAAHCESAR
jgi:hypothetical protein